MQVGKPKKRANSNKHRGNNPYYQTKEWKRMRSYIWIRDEGLCQQCLRDSKLYPLNRGKMEGFVDHIIPRGAQGSTDAEDNLELLCKFHHDSKSSMERKNIIIKGGGGVSL